jgi:hypothetical protein
MSTALQSTTMPIITLQLQPLHSRVTKSSNHSSRLHLAVIDICFVTSYTVNEVVRLTSIVRRYSPTVSDTQRKLIDPNPFLCVQYLSAPYLPCIRLSVRTAHDIALPLFTSPGCMPSSNTPDYPLFFKPIHPRPRLRSQRRGPSPNLAPATERHL